MAPGHVRLLTASMAVTLLLCAPAGATQVRLAWLPVQGAAGYRAYWRPSTQWYGEGTDVGAIAPDADGIVRYVLSDVPTDAPTYFAVTSYDADGVESWFSNELLLKAPLPCSAAPIRGCRAPMAAGGSVLSVRNVPGANRDRLGWSWRDDASAEVGDFGDPSRETSYVLCIYDDSRGVSSLATSVQIPPSGVCGGKPRPCWRDLRGRGFAYRNRSAAAGGILRAKLKQGADGRETIQVNSKGQSVTLPDPVAGSVFHQDPALIVQLVNDAVPSVCWEATYSADARVHTPTRFKDTSD